ncbi:MAG: chromosomal replication initiator protein DnaA [bacterium]|nr:chromosomal replication initiator protein DnaA [bacterium]
MFDTKQLDTKQLWDKVLADVELTVSKANFGTWFRNTFIAKHDDGIIYVSVPNTFVRDWLANKYHKVILKSLRETNQEIRGIDYVITKIDSNPKAQIIKSHSTDFNTLGLNDFYINRDSNLNPKYSLDNFIVGTFNEVAHAASQAVIKNPGMTYNPLFIYGGTGLGKTHLIQGVGNTIKNNFESKKVYYITSENFKIDFVSSLHNNKINHFKEKYRKYDVLIMDDVQFLARQDKTQEELFHLFNHFYENNKQIIFSSDKPPKYIPDIEDRVRSRLEGGMIADISKPDYESRLAILQSKIKVLEIEISDEIIEYLASIIQDSIRELEGSLNSIICQIQLKKREINLTEAKNLVKDNLKPQKTVSIKDVMKIVSEFYNIEEKTLYEKTRRKEVVKPRQIAMYLLREDFNTSYPYIGQKLGGRDHTTVIHAYEKIKKDIKIDQLLSQDVNKIREIMYKL